MLSPHTRILRALHIAILHRPRHGPAEVHIKNHLIPSLITNAANCVANAAFEPTATGGDGDDVQFWYVGYNPPMSEVIVGYQGTDTADM